MRLDFDKINIYGFQWMIGGNIGFGGDDKFPFLLTSAKCFAFSPN